MSGSNLRIDDLRADERESAAQVLAAAFRDNPLNVAVIGGDERRRLASNLHGSRVALGVAVGPGLVLASREGGGIAGVLIAAPPGAHPFPMPPAMAQLRCLVGQGWRTARRWSRVHFELERAHPREPHWYVDLLGVQPDSQRQGLGATLLAAFLERVDAASAPSYLESDRRRNVDFYAGHGYEVIGSQRILGVEVWRLWRQARG